MSAYVLPPPTSAPAAQQFNVAISGLPGNSTWIIRDTYDNAGSGISLPANVVLQFEGGSIANYGSISGSRTHIVCPYECQCFDGSGTFSNTWVTSNVSPMWFGAKYYDGTSASDATSAFNKAVYFFPNTSPPDGGSPNAFNGWGQGTVVVPKGIFLVNGTIGSANIIGLNIEGDAQFATSIITTTDTGSMFSLNTNISLKISDITFVHVPVATSGWEKVLFTSTGNGGGRNFRLERIYTKNFGKIIAFTGAGNSDTNVAEHCTFADCEIFLETVNTQAVLNEFNNCTWGGKIQKAFNIAGFSKTYIRSGNIVMDGTFLYLRNLQSKFGVGAEYTLENCKLEWTGAHSVANAVPKLFWAARDEAVGNPSQAGFITILGGGLTGGSAYHPDSKLFTYGCAMKVFFKGGSFEGKPELVTATGYLRKRNVGLIMDDTDIVAPQTWDETTGALTWNWILTGSLVSGNVFPNVSLINCGKSNAANGRHTDLNFALNKSQPAFQPTRTMSFGPDNATADFTTNLGASKFPLLFYTQPVLINSLKFVIYFKELQAAGPLDVSTVISVYTNAAMSGVPATRYTVPLTAIGTYTVIDLALVGFIVTEGIFIRVDKSDATVMRGNFIANYTSL